MGASEEAQAGGAVVARPGMWEMEVAHEASPDPCAHQQPRRKVHRLVVGAHSLCDVG